MAIISNDNEIYAVQCNEYIAEKDANYGRRATVGWNISDLDPSLIESFRCNVYQTSSITTTLDNTEYIYVPDALNPNNSMPENPYAGMCNAFTNIDVKNSQIYEDMVEIQALSSTILSNDKNIEKCKPQNYSVKINATPGEAISLAAFSDEQSQLKSLKKAIADDIDRRNLSNSINIDAIFNNRLGKPIETNFIERLNNILDQCNKKYSASVHSVNGQLFINGKFHIEDQEIPSDIPTGDDTLIASSESIKNYAFLGGANGIKKQNADISAVSNGYVKYEKVSDNCYRLTVKYGIKTIGQSAFSGCYDIDVLRLPATTVNIAANAFYNCYNIKQIQYYNLDSSNETGIVIGDQYCNIANIGNKCFQLCKALSSIYLGNKLSIIPQYAFTNCLQLSSITIPDSVTEINNYAFSNCNNISSIILGANLKNINIYAFKTNSAVTEISSKAIIAPKISNNKSLTNTLNTFSFKYSSNDDEKVLYVQQNAIGYDDDQWNIRLTGTGKYSYKFNLSKTLSNTKYDDKQSVLDESYPLLKTVPDKNSIISANFFNDDSDILKDLSVVINDCVCYSDCGGYSVCYCYGNCNNY